MKIAPERHLAFALVAAVKPASVMIEENDSFKDIIFNCRCCIPTHYDFQAVLIRDIVGNPFRPVAFDAAWRTSTATALARQMYESRDFGAMPILADALQDAGCDNEDVLNHCRDANATHVRGCWVVDLVLGKA
jgi:hypothetical protein